MLKNYLKTTLRNLKRFKGYTFINVFGLVVGLSCCILIMLFIKDELNYDRFHKNSNRIYRIVTKYSANGKSHYLSATPAPLASAILNEFQNELKIIRLGSGEGDIIKYGTVQTKDNRFMLADPNMLDVFTIPLIKGNPNGVLDDPHSVIISESIADKYFRNEDPIDKVLQIGKNHYFQSYKVSGVFKDLPSNSYLQFDCLASFQNAYFKENEGNLTWGAYNYETFALFQKNHSPHDLELRFTKIFEKSNVVPVGSKTEFLLQPLTSIHINLDPMNELPTERRSEYIFIFACIALLILLIVCINYINLTIAHASVREKEVGIRKVIGASKFQLANQFLGESIMLSLLAFLLSIPFVEVILPIFNQYSDKHLSLFSYDNICFIAVLPLVTVITGILAGSYPAFFISSFKPVAIFRGRLFNGKTNTRVGFRKIFVIGQFIIAIFFIGCTLILHYQLHYMKDKNPGYDKDNLVVLPIGDEYVKSKYELYKNEILRNTAIKSAAATSFLPSERGYKQNVHFKGSTEGSINCIKWIPVDMDFIKTMGLELTTGKDFLKDHSTGITYILNGSAVKQIGWKNPLGKSIDIIGWGPVIGVVKDFHFESLHNRIEPVALCVYPAIFQYLYVRIKPENTFTTMRFLESRWKEVFPGKDFEYSFFNEDFDKLYKTEIRLANVFNFIAALSMLVGCLGLFGLAQYAVERRTKEIGIRKIMGSSTFNVVTLLIKDFIKWVGIAIVLAWPATYYVMNKWLQGFAYRINISIWIFIISGAVALTIAVLTVSTNAIKAATANPVKSLKYE